MTIQEALKEALVDQSLYERTRGGITLSGGEPTMQHEFALAFMQALREAGIHVALDTCGQCEGSVFLPLAKAADLVLFDLKHCNPNVHKRLTGVGNEQILRNLAQLNASGISTEIRIPIVPTLNDDMENLRGLASLICQNSSCITRVVLLGYHPLGQTKIYQFSRKGANLRIQSPDKEKLMALVGQMADWTKKTVVWR